MTQEHNLEQPKQVQQKKIQPDLIGSVDPIHTVDMKKRINIERVDYPWEYVDPNGVNPIKTGIAHSVKVSITKLDMNGNPNLKKGFDGQNRLDISTLGIPVELAEQIGNAIIHASRLNKKK